MELLLDKRFASFLKRAGVELTAEQGAKREGETCLLPIVGGQIDPGEGRGEALSEGALLFRSAHGKVPLRRIRVKSTRVPLIAKVGGSQLKLAGSKTTTAARAGFGTRLTATELELTSKLTTRLNKKLRPKLPFQANQPLGTLIASAQPRLATIEEGAAPRSSSTRPSSPSSTRASSRSTRSRRRSASGSKRASRLRWAAPSPPTAPKAR